MSVNNCEYPDCERCSYPDCVMDSNDISAMLKRRRWDLRPEYYRQKQRDYRKNISSTVPKCNECKECAFVKNSKSGGISRVCILEMQIIERKVSASPRWCKKRKESVKG